MSNGDINLPLALGFLSPLFLVAGLLLACIPIIIHILNRRRFKTVTWAAMEFLLRAMRKNRRRLKFEHWLLLAVRCLVLMLLGLALARPMGCENGALAGIGRRTSLTVFVIDNSYSMSLDVNRPDAKSLLDRAKKAARTLLDRPTTGGDAVAIITAARPAAVIARTGYDLEAARSAVDRIEQSYSGTDLAGALQSALKIADEQPNQMNKELVLLTDSTRSAWEGPQAQSLKELGPELGRQFKITHYSVNDGAQWNAAVVDLKPGRNLVTNRFPIDFQATVKAFGGSREASLQWKLDDAILDANKPLTLDSATPAQTEPQVPFKSGGPHVVTATLLDDDKLPIDNTRYRVVDVASELKTLIVEGKRGINVLEGSGAFLQLALAPPRAPEPARSGQPQATSDSYVSPELISDLELGNKLLTDYSVIVLAGVGQVTPAEADQLAKFVQQGGTLMAFMGDAVNKENYNSVLLPRKLLPGALVKLMSVGTDQRGYLFDFKPKSVLHPFLSAFANQEDTGLESAQVFTYWQVDVTPNGGVDAVLNYLPPDGPAKGAKTAEDPAITTHSLGQGHVVWISTTANPDWTNLPAKLVYVPLVHELLAGSVRSGDYWMNLTVGQRLEIPPAVRLAGAPSLADPAGKPVVWDPAPENPSAYRSPPLARPGLYSLSLGNRKVPVAVNVPALDEADVRTISGEDIQHALGDVPLTLKGPEVQPESLDAKAGNDFSWWCMAMVMGLAGVECFMAMRFSHYRRADIAA